MHALRSFILILAVIYSANKLFGQVPGYYHNEIDYDSIIVHTDMPVYHLDQALVLPKPDINSPRGQAKYSKLVRDFKKAYPYALLINEVISQAEKVLDSLPNDRARKKHMRNTERYLRKKYGRQLRKLTTTQGYILVKLVNRETGDTGYELIKEMKNGLVATFYQGIAKLFKNDLRAEYDPKGADRAIERLVILYEYDML